MYRNDHLTTSRRIFYLNPTDWSWWAWVITTILIILGLFGHPAGFVAAMALTLVQLGIMLLRDRNPRAFPVQVRIAYLLLLAIYYVPHMRWLYWLTAIGTLALVIFGYCLLVRLLSLLPWNSSEALSLQRLRRTFFSAPDLQRAPQGGGGLCTIEAQVAHEAAR